ncbi:MAG TPA: sensor histidine kinase [Bacillota bacterium]|nr:sensor histidine kinase [Bacillota bacterium]
MSDRLQRVIILISAIVLQSVAFIKFFLQYDFYFFINNPAIPPYWKNYFTGLFIISLIITGLLFLGRSVRAKEVLIGLQGVIALLIGQYLGDYFGIELLLIAAIIIEAGILTPFWHGLFLGSGMIGVGFLFQSQVTIVDIVTAPITPQDQLFYFGLTIVLLVLTASLRFERENQIPAAELNRRLQESTLALAETNMKLQEYAITAEQDAMIKERKRIARDIHDTLAYTLTNLVMMLEAALDLTPPQSKDLVKHLELARDQAKEGLVEVRQSLQALRPVQFSGFSGLSAIPGLVKAFEKATQIKVELELGNIPLYLGEEANLTLFRLVQEGMTNALRHGKATFISIIFTLEGDGVAVTIQDNGIGSGNSGPKSGFGLIGMQERVERLGGFLKVFSIPGVGFTLKAWIPLTKEC